MLEYSLGDTANRRGSIFV